MRPFVFACLLLASLRLPAQEPVITADTHASYDQLHAWLHSGNPRLIAWAATLARTSHNTTILNEMPALLLAWKAPPLEDVATAREETLAVEAVLDALIQEHAAVSSEQIEAIARRFPAQALLLVKRQSLEAMLQQLTAWTATDHGYSAALQRVAVMLLAQHPHEGKLATTYQNTNIVDGTLLEAQETLTLVLVSASGAPVGLGDGAGLSFGFSSRVDARPAWPAVFFYSLWENASSGKTIVDLHGDSITAAREHDEGGVASNNVNPLNEWTRHSLLAYWLGTTPTSMEWQPFETREIVWRDRADFYRQVGDILIAQQARLQETSDQLARLGLISAEDAHAARPQLRVGFLCDIHPCPVPALR